MNFEMIICSSKVIYNLGFKGTETIIRLYYKLRFVLCPDHISEMQLQQIATKCFMIMCVYYGNIVYFDKFRNIYIRSDFNKDNVYHSYRS